MKPFEEPTLWIERCSAKDILTASEETEEPTGHSDFTTPPDEFDS